MTGRKEQPGPPPDEEPLSGGGVFRRGGLLRRIASRAAPAGSVFSEIYAPTHYEATIQIEAQRRVGKPAPSPTDPPDLEPSGPAVADERFRGRIVLRSPRIR